jgi:hypothetical protein
MDHPMLQRKKQPATEVDDITLQRLMLQKLLMVDDIPLLIVWEQCDLG